ncbi:4-hydroxybenzoate octaprenyltransferase [Ventosimonas gracilis]|uniref:4-hydroxybenzoate octaprenyltransferase n=1 Tax=Ventosimonas gracilis TaxID=1680762 RepID=A0A139SUW2_9GAMM|nr:4-hydroxybenzoate octaprenyltransferase [Ventosimonas gracilis]KXU38396.1 4-hydroxybenzoate octaprenyltransferase [Ventosimonas gracilis]
MLARLLQSAKSLKPALLNLLPARSLDFIQLMRLNKPIGIWLLLWPTLWALWIAGAGRPALSNLLIFTLGTVLMRSAGCVLNDWADRDFDGHVKRTQNRPLATGKITGKEALRLAAGLLAASFLLVLCTNGLTLLWSLGAVAIAALYPLMKRYTFYPQLVLGAAFSWGMPMAFTAETGQMPPPEAWLLFLANLLWTVAYDTYYAMADREDDIKLGLKSTAILFGDLDRPIIALLQGMALLCLVLAGQRFDFGIYFYLGLLVAACCFSYQFYFSRARDAASCFRAFLHNHWAGLAILAGIIVDFLAR